MTSASATGWTAPPPRPAGTDEENGAAAATVAGGVLSLSGEGVELEVGLTAGAGAELNAGAGRAVGGGAETVGIVATGVGVAPELPVELGGTVTTGVLVARDAASGWSNTTRSAAEVGMIATASTPSATNGETLNPYDIPLEAGLPITLVEQLYAGASDIGPAETVRFDQMRVEPGDIHAKVADMDLNGVFASINFPSFLAGFGTE